MQKDGLGDRIKAYERHETGRVFVKGIPIVARMDGKAFHTLTRGMDKPFDETFMRMMQGTAKQLVQDTGADIGYVQSDEITLIWKNEDVNAQLWLGGKVFKWHSILASMTTSIFAPAMAMVGLTAMFDARVFQVPNLVEAMNVLTWREQDAVRNSVQMLAQSLYSHKELQGKNASDLQDMCWEMGHNWNDLSSDKKRGTYYKRIHVFRKFTTDEIDKLPEKHEARTNPDLYVERKDVVQWDIDIITKYRVEDRMSLLFNKNRIEIGNYTFGE